MKKLFYEYSNGEYSIHTKHISDRTMDKEAKGADRVSIYECNDINLDQRLDGFSAGKFITTKLLK